MRTKTKQVPIDEAPFFLSLRKRTQKLYLTKSGKIRRNFSHRDRYQRDILEICLKLSALLETLRLSRFFLNERRNIQADNHLQIKNAAFVRYHLECYFIRITSYKDLMLKLFNRVYRFGFTERNGLEGAVTKKATLDNNSDLSHLLQGLSIIMSSVSPIRNKIAHGGYHEDLDLIMIEGEEIIKRGKSQGTFTPSEYNKTFRGMLERNIIDMHANESMMGTLILLAYKKLHPVRKRIEKIISEPR